MHDVTIMDTLPLGTAAGTEANVADYFLYSSARGTSQEEEMRGLLHYYFDAVMPFLQVTVWAPQTFHFVCPIHPAL